MIIRDIVMMVVEAVRDGHDLPLKIDRFHFAGKEIDPLQKFSDGIDDIGEIEIAGGDFVQHRGKQKEVVTIYQRDFDIGIAGERVIEVHRRMQSGKTTAENQNPSFLLQSHNISPKSPTERPRVLPPRRTL